MENYHSDCDINLDCDCHHLGCDQLYALNGNRNNKQKVPVGVNPIGTFFYFFTFNRSRASGNF